MIIISQNGMDFPYEQIVVEVDENNVVCRPISNMCGKCYPLGEYVDWNRANEVFYEILDKFEGYEVTGLNRNILNGYYPNIVYHMPDA